MIAPCKDCDSSTGRYPGCHDHCKKPEYLEWRRQLEKIKLARRKEVSLRDIRIGAIYRTKKKMRK